MVVHPLVLAIAMQTQVASAPAPSMGTGAPLSASAARAIRPPAIDGRGDDAVWLSAVPITEFREFQPNENGNPRFRTEARFAHDASNIYVFVRSFDSYPDSILRLLARRDVWTPADMIWLFIDSYHDRRTGFEFAVNPAGVKIDGLVSNDGNEDWAWDAVWDVATVVDSLGWTAEYRIPLSQLRYAPGAERTFGVGIWRSVRSYSERVSWPVRSVHKPGIISQLGELTGLDELPTPRRFELAPYVLTKNVPVPTGNATYDRSQDATLGADFKYGITSNLTLNATVNPDFGQVEADPAVLNLTAFETFFSERRPFFVAGTGLFNFPVNCVAVVDCGTGERLVYSRRIGRAPRLTGQFGDARSPTATTILGAAKLSGRFPGGLSVGFLEAATQRAVGTQDRTIEPAANHAVFRLSQELRGGETGIGLIATALNRDLDQWTSPSLRRNAYVMGTDLRHRFLNRGYEVNARISGSRVDGDARAIAATQRDAPHYFQRPDGALTYDSTRTSLSGGNVEVTFGRVGGKWVRFETAYQYRSPGYEINDLGFLQRADRQAFTTWAQVRVPEPRGPFLSFFWNVNFWQYMSAAGLPHERAFNTNVHMTFRNRWNFHAGNTFGALGPVYSDRAARGGPAVRTSPSLGAWWGLNSDDRLAVAPSLWFNAGRSSEGRSHYFDVNPSVRIRLAARFNTSVSVNLQRNTQDVQWFGNFRDGSGTLHYTFAHLEQWTRSMSWRLDYTVSPTLTVQLYTQPFVSKGQYSDVRELSPTPRADSFDDRYRPYTDPAVTANPGGFNVKQFRSNLVLRWEYRPGSTLFLVWTQGRARNSNAMGNASFGGDLGDLFQAPAENVFLVKASYWINW